MEVHKKRRFIRVQKNESHMREIILKKEKERKGTIFDNSQRGWTVE